MFISTVNPLAVQSFFRSTSIYLHYGHARSRRRASVCRGGAPLVRIYSIPPLGTLVHPDLILLGPALQSDPGYILLPPGFTEAPFSHADQETISSNEYNKWYTAVNSNSNYIYPEHAHTYGTNPCCRRLVLCIYAQDESAQNFVQDPGLFGESLILSIDVYRGLS